MSRRPPASLAGRWRSQWLIPLVPVVLGAVVLVAEATEGDLASGLIWFAVIAGLGGCWPNAVALLVLRRISWTRIVAAGQLPSSSRPLAR